MKKLFSILIAGIVLSFVMSSCNNKTEDDPGYNPILDSKAHSIAARKAAKIARRQMRDLEAEESIQRDYLDTAETLSFKDDIDRQKKNDEPAVKKDTCCPPVVVVVVPDYYPAPAPAKRGSGIKTPRKHDCPTYPGPKKECKTCNPCPTPRTIFIDGEQYTEYTGWDPVKKRLRPQDEQPVDANGQPKTGFLFKDSAWWQKN